MKNSVTFVETGITVLISIADAYGLPTEATDQWANDDTVIACGPVFNEPVVRNVVAVEVLFGYTVYTSIASDEDHIAS